MKEISKRTAIDKIVRDEMQDIEFEIQQKGVSGHLREILEVGHDGWMETSVVELQRELDNRFDGDYTINPEL